MIHLLSCQLPISGSSVSVPNRIASLPNLCRDQASPRELFGHDPDRVIGPVYQGYIPHDAFRPVCSSDVRQLTSSDDADLITLRSACTSEEWDHGGSSAASEPRFGYFMGAQLVAVAGTDRWTADSVAPRVLTHRDHRGRGYGTAVVSAVIERALAMEQLPVYQTLMENTGSVLIAERLGYRRYATQVAVRIEPETA